MIRKIQTLVFSLGLLVCFLGLPGGINLGYPGLGTLSGGVLHPFASSVPNSITAPQAERQMTVNERFYSGTVAPAGGVGYMFTWRF